MNTKKTDVVARTAEQALTDTRFDWARPMARRRIVVAAWASSVAVLVAATWNNAAMWTLAALLALGGSVWTLRGVVRKVADLPEEYIDERMNAVRNRAYRQAYAGLSSVIAAFVLLLALADDASRVAFDVDGRHMEALLWLVLGVAFGLPSAIIALNEPEL